MRCCTSTRRRSGHSLSRQSGRGFFLTPILTLAPHLQLQVRGAKRSHGAEVVELDFNQSAPWPHGALMPEWISCVEYRVVSKYSTQWVQEVFDKYINECKTGCTHSLVFFRLYLRYGNAGVDGFPHQLEP